jgi:WD40 repeat protein
VDGSKLAAGLNDGAVVVWNEDGTKSFELKIEHSKDLSSREISSIRWNGVEEKSHLFVTGSFDQVNSLQFGSTSVDYLTSDTLRLSDDRGPSSGTRTSRLRSTFSIFIQIGFWK